MQQIINFIIRYQTGLFFWLLFFVAILLTIQANTYHNAKFFSASNSISGWFYKKSAATTAYFKLAEENKILSEENAWLREKFHHLTEKDSIDRVSFSQESEYSFIPARIISNSYRKPSNYLLLNKGEKDGIEADMAIISSRGIVGIVEESSKNYARIISILNTNISINASFQHAPHFGSLVWNSASPYYAQLLDVPRSANIQVGDSIVTGGNSLIFPQGIPIGEVNSFFLDENIGYYQIEVKLFNDMTSLGSVYAIKLHSKEEAIELLENSDE